MSNHFSKTAAGWALAIVCLAQAARAQAPAPAPLAIPNPNYISIPLEITVNRPAAEVWKRVGKYCDIGEWLRVNCTIISGKDGEFGAVRSIGNRRRTGVGSATTAGCVSAFFSPVASGCTLLQPSR